MFRTPFFCVTQVCQCFSHYLYTFFFFSAKFNAGSVLHKVLPGDVGGSSY